MITTPKHRQAIRLLTPGAAAQRLTYRLATGGLIAATSYLLVITLLEVAAIAARMQ